MFQAKFLPHTGDCHIVTCARDGQVRLAQLSTTGTCKATKRLATHKMAAHKVYHDVDNLKMMLMLPSVTAQFICGVWFGGVGLASRVCEFDSLLLH